MIWTIVETIPSRPGIFDRSRPTRAMFNSGFGPGKCHIIQVIPGGYSGDRLEMGSFAHIWGPKFLCFFALPVAPDGIRCGFKSHLVTITVSNANLECELRRFLGGISIVPDILNPP